MFMAFGDNADEICECFGFTLGLALQEYAVDLHAGLQMENHHHEDVLDALGQLPAFKNFLHAELAKAFNSYRGRFDYFWDNARACDTRQPTDEETLENLVYTEVNPVKAGLVKWPEQWPGFTTAGWKFGETRTFKRPDWYHDKLTKPEQVTITRVRPKIFMELSDDELWELLQTRVRQRCLEIQAKMRRKGRRFKGAEKLKKEGRRWDRAPTSYEERFTIKPTVAASCKWRRIAQLQRDRDWEREYAAAREALKRREHPSGPAFPYGTYYLRIHCGVRVAQAPP